MVDSVLFSRTPQCQSAYEVTISLLSQWDESKEGPELLCPSLAFLSRDFFLLNEGTKQDPQDSTGKYRSKRSSNRSTSFPFPTPNPSSNKITLPSSLAGLTAPLSSPPNNPQSIYSSFNLQEAVKRLEKTVQSTRSGNGSSHNSGLDGNLTPEASVSTPISDKESVLIRSLTATLLHDDKYTKDIDTNVYNPFSKNYNVNNNNRGSNQALNSILTKFNKTPRRVCQHPFRKNDIVWVCRTCQSDETCVLCHDCYTNSNHEGHDVAFYHAQAGGCCDCGDPDAWDPKGFCHLHGDNYKTNNFCQIIEDGDTVNMKDVEERAKGIVEAMGDWLVKEVVTNVEKGWKRTNSFSEYSSKRAVSSKKTSTAATSSMDIDLTTRKSAAPITTHSLYNYSAETEAALELGREGLYQQGLYLTLHSDDFHSSTELAPLLSQLFLNRNSTSPHISKITRLFKNSNGNLILWGTNEILAEVGEVTASLWKDGDRNATLRIANILLEKAHLFRKQGFHVYIQTHFELQMEQRAIAALHWLSILARSCDALCEVVAHSLTTTRHLIPLLEADLKLPRTMTSSWHALLLTLLAIPDFKQDLAAAYCDSYGKVTSEYAKGVGVMDSSCFTLSVQFLNREKYVKALVQRRCLLERLTKSLLETLRIARNPPFYGNDQMPGNNDVNNGTEYDILHQRRDSEVSLKSDKMPLQSNTSSNKLDFIPLNPMHPVLSHRRYAPCISDLKCVLNVVGMAREFAAGGKCLRDWLELLSFPQGMDGQIWRTLEQRHVDVEQKGWIGAFNASISLGSLFERILFWEDNDPSPFRRARDTPLLSAAEVTLETLIFISKWQEKYFLSFASRSDLHLPQYEKASATLPYASVSVKNAALSKYSALPISQVHPWSFHYPLHRFAASCLRECNRRVDKGMEALEKLLLSPKASPQTAHVDVHGLLRGLMEISLLIYSRAAQIRAGMWKRNGQGMHDQVLNYAEPPFCRALRDSDLTVLQFAIVAMMKIEPFDGIAHFTNLSVQRFGVFNFCGLLEAIENFDDEEYKAKNNSNISENENLNENTFGYSNGDDVTMKETLNFKPKRKRRHKPVDNLDSLLLFEELLHLWILLLTETPTPPTSASKDKSIDQAKARLRREVIHRLASGPKTHSELAEVHHVLPLRDNTVLNDEGRKKNPDDATGAALEDVLELVATQQSLNNFGPNKWELNKKAWVDYDPAFWHIAQRAHQTIAENKPLNEKGKPYPYAPRPSDAHVWFQKLRWGLISDAVVVSLCYRVLHIHCCEKLKQEDNKNQLRGEIAYQKVSMSETALSRTIHLLTLAAYAWDMDYDQNDSFMKNRSGSIFNREDTINCETWINKALLAKPEEAMDNPWYKGEDCALLLLKRLATKGNGRDGGFSVQDSSLKRGAEWLCEFAKEKSYKARLLLNESDQKDQTKGKKQGMDLQQRKKEAQKRAMQKMMNMKKHFEAFMEENDEGGIDSETSDKSLRNDSKMENKESEDLSTSSDVSSSDATTTNLQSRRFLTLLKERPQCIICNGSECYNSDDDNGKCQSKSNNNALAFCAHAQASTVLKGGGGPPNGEAVSRFVGTHVALCGHAVHISCCDKYLATVAARDASSDRNHNVKKEEFRCPLCKRLSNCLVPFIDVGMDWIDTPSPDNKKKEDSSLDTKFSIYTFLSTTKWIENSSSQPKKSYLPVKSRRSISKKDLFTAWHAVMRPPRFRRTQLSTNSNSITTDTSSKHSKKNAGSSHKEKFSGVTDVWRRLMDQLSNVSHRADWKRLGEDDLSSNYGEFRHYHVEKVAYNKGKDERVDWPLCLYQTQITDSQRNELSREKLISKLLLSIQAFTYSISAEAADILHRSNKGDKSFYSMFGVKSVSIDDSLILMPNPEGEEVFHGRLGNLRRLGLSIMAASSALAKEVINLVLPLNYSGSLTRDGGDKRYPLRSPIAYPLLYGHILTHTVAAMCAACGSYRASSDSMGSGPIGSDDDAFEEDLGWMDVDKSERNVSYSLASIRDCENFVKIGMIARTLQTLLGHLNFGLSVDADKRFIKTLENSIMDVDEDTTGDGWSNDQWRGGCLALLKAATANAAVTDPSYDVNVPSLDADQVFEQFFSACSHARDSSLSFLSGCALFLQVLIPGTVNEKKRFLQDTDEPTMSKLLKFVNIEPLSKMMSSTIMRSIVSNWYQDALRITNNEDRSDLVKMLYCKREFRKIDWPLTATIDIDQHSAINEISGFSPSPEKRSGTLNMSPQQFSLKKSVPLLGGYKNEGCIPNLSDRPRIKALPTSYTDLYAELGALCPDTERATALCLVCGETLNACGRGECTKHALKCGGGSGIFFLVQECIGLIMHGQKASYIHSPYVDSHGETPQYRGRPLNLDLNRYESLRVMWGGHLVRERVITERGSSRQVIIPNFY